MPNIPLTAPDVDDLVDQAYSDVRALPKYPYPSLGSVIVNHPGVLQNQILTDQEYQEKRKYDALMRRLGQIQEQLPDQFAQKQFPVPGSDPIYGRDIQAGPQDTSPYRRRDMLGAGMPLANALQVVQAPFSVAANTLRAAYDLPKAAEEAPYVANKATGGLFNIVQGKDPNPTWSAEREFAGRVPFDSPLMMLTEGNPGSAYGILYGSQERGSLEGPQVLKEDFGFPDTVGTDMAGNAIEALVDPIGSPYQIYKTAGRALTAGSRAAMKANATRAAKLLGVEMALPTAFTAGSAVSRLRGESP